VYEICSVLSYRFTQAKVGGLSTWKTRNPAVARVGADRTGCHWPWRPFKVDDFCYLKRRMPRPCSDNSNLGSILHRLATIHLLQTDRQIDGWTTSTTHDKGPTLSLQLSVAVGPKTVLWKRFGMCAWVVFFHIFPILLLFFCQEPSR